MPNRKRRQLQAKIQLQDNGKDQACKAAASTGDQEEQPPLVNPWAAAKQEQENLQSFFPDIDFPPLQREPVKQKGKKDETGQSQQVHQATPYEPAQAPDKILSAPTPKDPLPPSSLLYPTGCESKDGVKISGDLDNCQKDPVISDQQLNYVKALNDEMFKSMEVLNAELVKERARVKERDDLLQELKLQKKKSGGILQQSSRSSQTPEPTPCQGAKPPQVSNPMEIADQQQLKLEPCLKDLLFPTGCESKDRQRISGESGESHQGEPLPHQSVITIPELELQRMAALKDDVIFTLGEEKEALLKKVEQLKDELAGEKARRDNKSRLLLQKLESEKEARFKASHNIQILQSALQRETEKRKQTEMSLKEQKEETSRLKEEQAELKQNLETQRVQLEEDRERLLKEARSKAKIQIKMLQTSLQRETKQQVEQAEVIRTLEAQRVQLEENTDRLLKEARSKADIQIKMLQTSLQHETEQRKKQAEVIQNLKTQMVKWEEDRNHLLAQQLDETSRMREALKNAQQDLDNEGQEWQEEKFFLTEELRILKETLEEKEAENNTTRDNLMERLQDLEHQREEVQKKSKKRSLRKRFLRLFKRTSDSDLQQQP